MYMPHSATPAQKSAPVIAMCQDQIGGNQHDQPKRQQAGMAYPVGKLAEWIG